MSLILRERGCFFGHRDDTLFWQNISRVFLSLFVSHFLIWEVSIYRKFNSIWFEIFSQHLLKFNYELWINFGFPLIRTFHMSLFFWRCHMAFFIWCCHMAWFCLLIVCIINWKLTWSKIFDHDQLDGCGYIIKNLMSTIYLNFFFFFFLRNKNTHRYFYFCGAFK